MVAADGDSERVYNERERESECLLQIIQKKWKTLEIIQDKGGKAQQVS